MFTGIDIQVLVWVLIIFHRLNLSIFCNLKTVTKFTKNKNPSQLLNNLQYYHFMFNNNLDSEINGVDLFGLSKALRQGILDIFGLKEARSLLPSNSLV